jgi:hypothetical protein
MTTESKIKAASSLTYNPKTDELFADGQLVGGASDLTRDLMLARLSRYSGDDLDEKSDETLFDLVVEAA